MSDTLPINRRQFLAGAAAGSTALMLAHGAALAATGASKMTATSTSDGAFWPNGARLAISISMQFEAGAQPERGASGPFPPLDPKYADLPMQSWYDYGVKEGIPRLLDLWDRTGVKVTSHMVGQAVDRSPRLAREIVARGHEAAAHGQTWEPQYPMTPEQELAAYSANIASIERATGTRPVGFNAFWLRGTPNTLSILQQLGFLYHIDNVSRDEPFTVAVKGKPFVVVPYTLRNNDIVRFDSPALSNEAYLSDLKAEFDVLYAEAGSRRRMMSISTHDRISGSPARVKALEQFIRYAQGHAGVAFMRKDEIARYALQADKVPAD
ncbi:polysaccharide deacetylase family protein [Chromobacterium sp.]|uniref:polysaccharide deacetylase family protein n=1 Tax=Chromobacterium sp. TaxID=306190 RepID=UPI0035B49FB9